MSKPKQRFKVQIVNNPDHSQTHNYYDEDNNLISSNINLPEVTVTANKSSAIDNFVEDIKYNLNPLNYRFKDLSDPKTQQELSSLALGFGIPLAAGVAPIFAPGTVGGTLLGFAAGGTAVGMGLEEAQRAIGGKSVGDMASEGLQNIGVPQIVADFVRPEYLVDPLHVGIAGKSMLNTAGRAVENGLRKAVRPMLVSKAIDRMPLVRTTPMQPKIVPGEFTTNNITKSNNTPTLPNYLKERVNQMKADEKRGLLLSDPTNKYLQFLGYNKTDRNLLLNNPRLLGDLYSKIPTYRQHFINRFNSRTIISKVPRLFDHTPYHNISLVASNKANNISRMLDVARGFKEAEPGTVLSAYYYSYGAVPSKHDYSQHSLPLIIRAAKDNLHINPHTYIRGINSFTEQGVDTPIGEILNRYLNKRFGNRESAKAFRTNFENDLEKVEFPMINGIIPKIYSNPVSTAQIALPSKLFTPTDRFVENRPYLKGNRSVHTVKDPTNYEVGLPYPEIKKPGGRHSVKIDYVSPDKIIFDFFNTL